MRRRSGYCLSSHQRMRPHYLTGTGRDINKIPRIVNVFWLEDFVISKYRHYFESRYKGRSHQQ